MSKNERNILDTTKEKFTFLGQLLRHFVPHHQYEGKGDNSTCNRVVGIDYLVSANGELHSTSMYYLMQKDVPELVVRRGKTFGLVLQFERALSRKHDDLKICFVWTDCGDVGKPFEVCVNLPFKDTPPAFFEEPWVGVVSRISKDGLKAEVVLSSNLNTWIGKYFIVCKMIHKENNKTGLLYKHSIPLFLLFNPWNKLEIVHLQHHNHIEEYVMKDIGCIFRGTAKTINYSHWKFSQFEEPVLEAALVLASVVGKVKNWTNIVEIVRSIAFSIEAPPGIMESNLRGGSPPLLWTGTRQILDLWYKTRTTVKYGQCFVFGGLLTGVFRSLGIPSRVTSSFLCGINPDETGTIDFFYIHDFEKRKKLNPNGETYWIFNVWSEVWMGRPDLGTPCGWNAVYSKAGPCYLNLLKNGEESGYNTKLFYNIVNSDILNWVYDANKPLKLISKETSTIGVNLSTKKINSMAREDVTHLYKNLERADDEIDTNTIALRSKKPIFQNFTINEENPNIKLVCEAKSVPYGTPMKVTAKLINKGKEPYEALYQAQVVSIWHNGVPSKEVKSLSTYVQLNKKSTQKIVLAVECSEYENFLDEDWIFKAYFYLSCEETDILKYTEFTVIPPQLYLQVTPSRPRVSCEVVVKVRLKNTGSSTLMGTFYMQQLDTEHIVSIPDITIAPNEKKLEMFTMVPTREGSYNINVVFKSIFMIVSTISINVLPEKKDKKVINEEETNRMD
ncbi:annulin-like [Cimex lectularius]|uniref:Transglutaminase-like domain-containing protein n=1 Tax=Cimex lectularius TaxID=79782 RepID=A0A8I6RLL3_CIMLE|nr:annulin-like [Cimex lectularius]